jgi:hypothetical protein
MSEEILSFESFSNAVRELFPELAQLPFSAQWQDDEGEMITFSTDRELAEAIRVMESTCSKCLQFRIVPSTVPSSPTCPESKAVHRTVTCDGCGMFPLIGSRFKCSVGDDFDLCESCEARGSHPYPLIKILRPSQMKGTSAPINYRGGWRGLIRDGAGNPQPTKQVPTLSSLEDKVAMESLKQKRDNEKQEQKKLKRDEEKDIVSSLIQKLFCNVAGSFSPSSSAPPTPSQDNSAVERPAVKRQQTDKGKKLSGEEIIHSLLAKFLADFLVTDDEQVVGQSKEKESSPTTANPEKMQPPEVAFKEQTAEKVFSVAGVKVEDVEENEDEEEEEKEKVKDKENNEQPCNSSAQNIADGKKQKWLKELATLGKIGFFDGEIIIPLLETHTKDGDLTAEGMKKVAIALLSKPGPRC